MKSEEDEGTLRERMDQELRKAQSELAQSSVEASAGSGQVKISMSGTQECLSVEIGQNVLEKIVNYFQCLNLEQWKKILLNLQLI